jgi:hypothetical protein
MSVSYKAWSLTLDLPIPLECQPVSPAAPLAGVTRPPSSRISGPKIDVRVVADWQAITADLLTWLDVVDAVAVYPMSPFLALCVGPRCVLVRQSGFGGLGGGNAPPSQLPECVRALFASPSIVKMTLDASLLMRGTRAISPDLAKLIELPVDAECLVGLVWIVGEWVG